MLNQMFESAFLRFALVGVCGLVVDMAILWVCLPLIGPFAGRVVSFTAAVATTWALNRSFTFAANARKTRLFGEFGRYFASMVGGGALNYGSYALLVGFVDLFTRYPLLAVAVGAVVGMAANFTLAKKFVFATSVLEPEEI